jgi:hypothetical protein
VELLTTKNGKKMLPADVAKTNMIRVYIKKYLS